jgi:hypothetical protein
MTRPQTRDEKYHWIYFLGLMAHLLDEDSIAASESEYPFALIVAGMESLVTWFGRRRRGPPSWRGHQPCIPSFLFEDIALIERELGPTDEEVPKKGKRLQ